MDSKNLIELKRNKLSRICFDLTYRCNNNCIHCWNRTGAEEKEELSLKDYHEIINDLKFFNIKEWIITGGEPMLHSDFESVLELLVKQNAVIMLNTNGILINYEILPLLKKIKRIQISLYGACRETHDKITRTQGSFDKTIKSFEMLKNEKIPFYVQIVPMRSNYSEISAIRTIAEKYGAQNRFSATWLHASRFINDKKRKKQILRERLKPNIVYESFDYQKMINQKEVSTEYDNQYMFSNCLKNKNELTIDPYGYASLCDFLIEDKFKYNLKKGNVFEAIEKYIPNLYKIERITEEYMKNCGNCNLQDFCFSCPAKNYMETKSYSKKIKYLCKLAKSNKKMHEKEFMKKTRFLRIHEYNFLYSFDFIIDKYKSNYNNIPKDNIDNEIVFEKIDYNFLNRIKNNSTCIYNSKKIKILKKENAIILVLHLKEQLLLFIKKENSNKVKIQYSNQHNLLDLFNTESSILNKIILCFAFINNGLILIEGNIKNKKNIYLSQNILYDDVKLFIYNSFHKKIFMKNDFFKFIEIELILTEDQKEYLLKTSFSFKEEDLSITHLHSILNHELKYSLEKN